ncbi:TPA: hypothetical protein ROY17_002002 [Bacillus thuringiensis]|nr:hypothetical protein [Bacillus thuringiensis]
MAKTYKTERGLKAALKKVLGEESLADSKSGKMTKGWMAIPLKGNTGLRVFMIDVTGYPEQCDCDFIELAKVFSLESDFGASIGVTEMFGNSVAIADIPLEVSK